jgi:hypothetical protein|tara:strand:- start:10 stop:174 length:165 start_codon:yes stop_codon:yes gene_type:complete
MRNIKNAVLLTEVIRNFHDITTINSAEKISPDNDLKLSDISWARNVSKELIQNQ